MRGLPNQGSLGAVTTAKLATETTLISGSADPKVEAEQRYKAARGAKWFDPVIRTLAIRSGLGQRCMCCSGSESSQVEHFKPKATFPFDALSWSNFLWICGICNQAKGLRFHSPQGHVPINPFVDDPWEYFFIDQFGNLSPKWDPSINNLNQRAVWTIELYHLDRQALQESRQDRLIDLRNRVRDSLDLLVNGSITKDDLEIRALEWYEQSFQPDVADFFFAGPGSVTSSEPFANFLNILSQ